MVKHNGCLVVETESWLARQMAKNPSGMIEGAYLEKVNMPTVFPAYFVEERSYVTKWWKPATKEEVARIWEREKQQAIQYYNNLLGCLEREV